MKPRKIVVVSVLAMAAATTAFRPNRAGGARPTRPWRTSRSR